MMLHRFDSTKALNEHIKGKNKSDFELRIEMCPAKTYHGYHIEYFVLDFTDKQQDIGDVK